MARRAVMARLDHPWAVRMCHWLTVVTVTVMIGSGLEIFAAFPSFGDKVPQRDLLTLPGAIRLGGWLGGALQWHLTFAWLFAAIGMAYAGYQAASGNYRQVLFTPSALSGVMPMVRYYLRLGPKPDQRDLYNPLQKLAYTAALALGALLVVTGLALFKPVQLSWMVTLLGGIRLVRVWHAAAMVGLLLFLPGHLLMVALHGWQNFAAMWTGERRLTAPVPASPPPTA